MIPAVRRAVFLDRDGVINEKIPGAYVRHWGEFRFLPGIAEALRRLRSLRYLLVVVTNQQGIGKGLMTERDLAAIHQRMIEELASSGAAPDAIYVCPHLDGGGCGCRKPDPGMILRAMADLGIDPSASWLAGDSLSDLEAARRAGVSPVLIGAPRSLPTADCPAFPDLLAFADALKAGTV